MNFAHKSGKPMSEPHLFKSTVSVLGRNTFVRQIFNKMATCEIHGIMIASLDSYNSVLVLVSVQRVCLSHLPEEPKGMLLLLNSRNCFHFILLIHP